MKDVMVIVNYYLKPHKLPTNYWTHCFSWSLKFTFLLFVKQLLKEEIAVMKDKLEHHPDVTRFAMENLELRGNWVNLLRLLYPSGNIGCYHMTVTKYLLALRIGIKKGEALLSVCPENLSSLSTVQGCSFPSLLHRKWFWCIFGTRVTFMRHVLWNSRRQAFVRFFSRQINNDFSTFCSYSSLAELKCIRSRNEEDRSYAQDLAKSQRYSLQLERQLRELLQSPQGSG